MVASCGRRELPVLMPVICSNSSAGADDWRSSSMSSIDFTRLSSIEASCAANVDRKRAPSAVSTRFHLRTRASVSPRRSAVLLQRGPQTGRVKLGYVGLHLLAAARGHHSLAL